MSEDNKSITNIQVAPHGTEPKPSMEATAKDNETIIEPGKGRFDLAAEFLQLHEEVHGDYSEADANRVRRKIDFIILPILTASVILNSVDVSAPKQRSQNKEHILTRNFTENYRLQRYPLWHDQGQQPSRSTVQLE